MIMKKYILTAILCAGSAMLARAEAPDSIQPSPKPVEIAVGSAIGLATNGALTEVLKCGVHEMRPDRSAHNSFPSRHSSWAFTASTLASNYLYRHSPWYSLGAQLIATGVGAQRIMARRHYGSDVIAGSVLGMASAEFGTFVARKIFGRGSGLSFYDVENDFRTSVAMTTGGAWWLDSPADADLCAAYTAAVAVVVPATDVWGVSASVKSIFAPVKSAEGVYPLGSAGISAGGVAHVRLPLPALALEPKAEIGGAWLRSTKGWHHSRCGFTAEASCTLSWRLTEHFATAATAGFGMITVPRAMASFNVSISSVALF